MILYLKRNLKSNNKKKAWVYGYNKEYDIVVYIKRWYNW